MTFFHELTLREPARRRGWDAPLGLRVALSGFTIYLLLIGANLATPLYPYLREQMGLSSTATTVTFATYVISLIVGLLCASHWSEYMGRRAVLVAAVAAGIVGAVIFGTATGLEGLVGGRLFQGIGVALATGASAAAVRDLLSDSPDAATRITLLSSAGGVASGPLLGGWLSTLGDPVLLPFGLHLVSLGLVLVPLLLLNARPAPQRPGEGPRARVLMPLRPTPPGEARRIFYLTSFTGFLSFCMFGFYLSLAPGYFAGVLGSSRIMTGVLAATVLGSSAVAQLVTLRPKHRGAGGLLLVAAGLAVVLLWGRQSAALLLTGSVLLGLGQGVAFRTLFTYMSASVPRSRHATTISLMYVITYMGSAVPIIALGAAIDAWGSAAAVPPFIAGMCVAALLLAAWTRFEPEPPRYVEVSVLESDVDRSMGDEPPHV
ncbi:MFS transporter [Falsarthrobacter nasiphocae]|uniref:MFS family permease n=1 Tax=Falsarthrobacter nasiphocae TaxID=189863 RepID=A0AAE3YHA1_9MICC|nr:MFS transporter [Falsarthrobacter nasiphocae]MDR6892189.1 MFS family permease [Falsarthrobacter nasiphocae]